MKIWCDNFEQSLLTASINQNMRNDGTLTSMRREGDVIEARAGPVEVLQVLAWGALFVC